MQGEQYYASSGDTLSGLGIIVALLSILLVILKSTIFVIFFAYYSIRQDLPECEACSEYNVPIAIIPTDGLSHDEFQTYQSCVGSSTNVTRNFQTLTIFLFITNTLLMGIMCAFCCMGRNSIKTYDRMFTVYNLLMICSVVNYAWCVVVRFRHAGMVCSGDMLSKSDYDNEGTTISESYITGFGKLFRWYFIVETVVTFCCCSIAALWICYTPRATSRFF